MRFIYKKEKHSDRRGYNTTITVYRIPRSGEPVHVGYNERIDSAATFGDRAEARRIIAKELGLKMADSYRFVRKDIQLFEV